MNLVSLRCPECNGVLDINCENRKFIFCPYCGAQIAVDGFREEKIITKNTNKYVRDEAKIIKAQNEAEVWKEKQKYMEKFMDNLMGIIAVVAVVIMVIVMMVVVYKMG